MDLFSTSELEIGRLHARHLKHSGCQSEPMQLSTRPLPIT